MKILYVNGTNAKHFDKENKKHPVFAKYFSPTCPACIAMEDVWTETCRDIDKKYDTDMIMAQIDPTGMTELEKMDTYNDVAYVPSLIVLQNGKKVNEYEGPKEKDKLIKFLLENGLIKFKSNMRGGSKKSRERYNNKKKSHKRIHTGRGQGISKTVSNDEFSFVENKDWLEPFLSKLMEQYLNDPTKIITNEEAIDFAIKKVNSIFRPKGLITKEFVQYKKDWEACPKKGLSCINSECRKSPGFGDRCVPSVRKFDPKYNEDVYKYNIKLAEQSYNYLKNNEKLNTLLRTPASDYTRFSLDESGKLDKEFVNRIRSITASQEKNRQGVNYFKAILDVYVNKTVPPISEPVGSSEVITPELQSDTNSEINIMDIPLDKLHLYNKGGRRMKSRRMKSRRMKSRRMKSRRMKSRRMKSRK
jgi:thiol-disulfide isomerase/thioredoxin